MILPRATAFILLMSAPFLRAAVDFNREVRPLLSDRCLACHGPDSAKREAGLRLDSFEGATTKLKSGHYAIVPGKPDESALVSRIHASDPEDIMVMWWAALHGNASRPIRLPPLS